MTMMSRTLSACWTLLLLAGVVGACHTRPGPVGPRVPAIAMTGGFTVLSDTLLSSDSAYAASIRALGLAASWETGHARTDMRRLIVGSCPGGTCTVGPLVQIIPASNAHLGNRASLAAGKLIAKIVTVPMSANQGAYPKFALDSGGTSYVFVDSTAGRWRMLFIPASAASAQRGTWRETWPYEVAWSRRERSARARFLWNDNDDEAWVTCKDMGCCAPPGMMDAEI